jgi:DNA-binding transcriptional ArsR family regulator
MDIVDHLAGGEPKSIKELAREIGRKPSAIYHHLEQLLGVGLIEEAGARVVNRKTERLFRTPAPRMRVKRALGERRNAALMREIVSALNRESDRDFSTGLDHPRMVTQGSLRNLGFFRQVNRPSPQSLARINALLDEIAEILWREPASDAPLVALTWTMAPLAAPEDA